VPRVARRLLGAVLESTVGGQTTRGVIVETEAYLGPEDEASHASTRAITPRNRVMFGPPGRAYVYRSYGVHWCVNVVAAPEGTGGAVLIRGLDPLEGRATMAHRREERLPLAAGPGRLTQALGIDGTLDGHPLDREPLRLLAGYDIPDGAVRVTPRIGITRAVEAPLRYLVRGRPGVSR
jgi:DNA-3-methyladenine glycosylase